MQRRFLLALLASTALAGGLTACGDDDNGDGGSAATGAATAADSTPAEIPAGTKVKFWIMPNGPDPKDDTEEMVKPFETQTGIDVDVEVVGWDVQFDRIRNAAVSGEGPDITQAGTTQVPFFAALNGFEDLSGRVEDVGGEAAYPEGVWETTKVTGRDGIFALPWFTEARAIYYRKDVLKKAGVDEATAFKDWQSFRATLQAIADKAPTIGGKPIKPFGSPGKKAFDLVHHVMPFVWNAGGSELSEDGSAVTISSAEAQTGVDFLAQLIKDGLYDASQLERDGTQVENQFKAGRIAVWMGGPWTLASTTRADDDNWVKAARENVGIAPIPAGPTGESATFVGGSNLMVLKSSKNKDAAWELLKFLSKDDVQSDYASLQGMFPARKAPQQAIGERDEQSKAFYTAIQSGRTFPTIPQWGQIEQALKARFATILDAAAGRGGKGYSEQFVRSQLGAAAKEADGLLQQSTG